MWLADFLSRAGILEYEVVRPRQLRGLKASRCYQVVVLMVYAINQPKGAAVKG